MGRARADECFEVVVAVADDEAIMLDLRNKVRGRLSLTMDVEAVAMVNGQSRRVVKRVGGFTDTQRPMLMLYCYLVTNSP